MRQPKDHEMLCKFGCRTIVDKSLASCEMCCVSAVSERAERLAPIIAEAQRLAQEKSERIKARMQPAEDEPEIIEPAPKKRGRPAKDL